MTDEPMTLRERVIDDMHDNATAGGTSLYRTGATLNAGELIDRIAAILEDTGAPAHMRVAKELRGEVG